MAETLIAAAPAARRVALFIDGTWNTRNDATNVWRMYSLCARTGADGKAQVPYYNVGLGTERGEKWKGGIFGYGFDAALIDSYEWLIENYNPGDEIFLFGFSRGAYTARSLAGLISRCGLLQAGAPLSVKQVYQRYHRGRSLPTIRDLLEAAQDGKRDFTLEERWIIKYSMPIPIKFIGVWDTVGALGNPFSFIPGRHTYHFLDTNLRVSNDFAFQAIALDEHRKAFAPTLWTHWVPKSGSSTPERPLSQVEQRWFVGAHANVGGSVENDLLPQLPLKWMMEKASSHGLTFRRAVELDGDVNISPVEDSFADFAYGAYKILMLGRPFYREIGAAPVDHPHTVENTINETIDASVFERWRSNPSYRPQNLQDWANGYNVDVGELRTAVRAHNPQDVVTE